MIRYIYNILLCLGFALISQSADAKLSDLPRFQAGIGASSMMGPGLQVQADISRAISVKGMLGGWYENFEPEGDVPPQYYRDLSDGFLSWGIGFQVNLDRYITERLYVFYNYGDFSFDEISNYEFSVVNDIAEVSYDRNELFSQNHSIGLGYEWIFWDYVAVNLELGYQYQYTEGDGFDWWANRSRDGSVSNGIGFGAGIRYVLAW